MTKCKHCPVTGYCPGLETLCRIAASEIPGAGDHVTRQVAAITTRSSLTAPVPPPPSARRAGMASVIELTRRSNACPFRSGGPGCCSGYRCGLRSGAVVSHVDCFACLRLYDPPPEQEQ